MTGRTSCILTGRVLEGVEDAGVDPEGGREGATGAPAAIKAGGWARAPAVAAAATGADAGTPAGAADAPRPGTRRNLARRPPSPPSCVYAPPQSMSIGGTQNPYYYGL
ncbi:hypothetical protein I4F81_009001 [Pyropia yezoensis]|uniref:Uncharacterized protein n=1 Tax=Pyropia yezoensis TaxID=2788 RepID=A0ACC3C8S8_PYRYE|nr:hypothetical protein I4F81_009001 [Neopyropia yezoensis]